ncbi:TlpA family protein disulfide reductase [Taibaiella sp. KBW10]|uniref:TlpA family protein disulfide reductase n=1 Tax=Taibaiella sp. KBW10 TaxID=2153357 RepID=UPI000F5A4824|nr:TlpA disulfide reductase family protein [Taibaiella sp. KBW10]RQO32343.1 TlpA family protein disulfide reductase [Taibaiella sp. KBW10]
MKKLLCALLLLGATSTYAQYTNQTVKVGDIAPELSFNNPEGKAISLKTLNKQRYILVDFWASWCGPCRRANPSLVKFYTEYSKKKFTGAKKGFDILSVSLDNNQEAWVAAIAKDSLYWKNHMSDLKSWQSEAATIYGVQYIPQAFLLDPNGKVLGAYLTADQAIPDIEKLVSTKKRKKFLGIF